MVTKIKLSQICIFVSVLFFIARWPFARSEVCAGRKPIVNSKSIIFFKKIVFNKKH